MKEQNQIKVKLKKPKFSTPQIQIRKENINPLKTLNQPFNKKYRQSSFFGRKKSDFYPTLQHENSNVFLNTVQTPKLKSQTPNYKSYAAETKINFKLPKTSKNCRQKLGKYFSSKQLRVKNIEKFENQFKKTKNMIKKSIKSSSNKVNNKSKGKLKLIKNYTKKITLNKKRGKSKNKIISQKSKNKFKNICIHDQNINENQKITALLVQKTKNNKTINNKLFNKIALEKINIIYYINYYQKLSEIFINFQNENKFFYSFKEFTELIQHQNFVFISKLFKKESKTGQLVLKKTVFEIVIIFTIFYLFVEKQKIDQQSSINSIFKYINQLNILFLNLLKKYLKKIQQNHKVQAIKLFIKDFQNIENKKIKIKQNFIKEFQKCLTIIELTFNKIIRKIKPSLRQKIQVLINQNTGSFEQKVEKIFTKFQQIFEQQESFHNLSQQLLEQEYIKKEQEGPNFIIQPFKSEIVLGPNETNKKYTLVLDLDETLIHFTEQEYGGQFLLRPYSQEFINKMAQFYEIVIFTAAVKDYADWIIDRLDEQKVISYRLYRCSTTEQNGIYLKDLNKIGRDLTKTIIVDNNPENFLLQPENGIYIKSWYEDPNDQALKELANILCNLASKNCDDIRSELKKLGKIHNESFELFNQFIQFNINLQMEANNSDISKWYQNYQIFKEAYDECQDFLEQENLNKHIQKDQESFRNMLDKFQEENQKQLINKVNENAIEYKVDDNKTFYLDENNNVIQFRALNKNPQVQIFNNTNKHNKLKTNRNQIQILKSRKKFFKKQLTKKYSKEQNTVSIQLQDSKSSQTQYQKILNSQILSNRQEINLKSKIMQQQKTIAFGQSKLFDGESLDTQIVDKIQDIISDLYKNNKVYSQQRSFNFGQDLQVEQNQLQQLQAKSILPSFYDCSQYQQSISDLTNQQQKNAYNIKLQKSQNNFGKLLFKQLSQKSQNKKISSQNLYYKTKQQKILKNKKQSMSLKSINLNDNNLLKKQFKKKKQKKSFNEFYYSFEKNSNQVGQYQLLEKLGQGNFGKVQKVQNINTKLFYAAKIISVKQMKRKYSLKGINFEKQLQREINILKSLNHPHIIKLIDVVQDKQAQKMYLITKYYKGGNLNDIRKKISKDNLIKICYEIILALNYLHNDIKIAHCDIKPQNIMLNQKKEANLIDFGCARFINDSVYVKKTDGTKAFQPPEVNQNKKFDVTKVDIWALGQTFFYMLTGKFFMYNENLNHSKNIQIIKNQISKDFQKLIENCLEYDYNKRYSCQQLLSLEIFKIFKNINFQKSKKQILFNKINDVNNMKLSKQFQINKKIFKKNKINISITNLSEIKKNNQLFYLLLKKYQNFVNYFFKMNTENYKIIKSSFVEFIAAYAIIFFTSYNTDDFSNKEKDNFLIILEHSVSLFFLIISLFWICERYSQAQFNPMISIGYVLLDKISITQAFFNIFAQIIGVICGDATLTLLDLKSTDISPLFLNFRNLNELKLIGYEVFFTFLIAFIQFSTLFNPKSERAISAVAVGGIYAVINLCFTNFYYSQYNFLWLLVQSSMNFVLSTEMIYITIGGLIGPLIATVYFKYLLQQDISLDKILNDYEPNRLIDIDE